MGTPSPPASGLQGLSSSLGWVPPIWSVFQGPTKPSASPSRTDPYPFHPTRLRGRCYQAAASRCIWPCLKVSPCCCQPFGRRCIPRLVVGKQLPLFVGARGHPWLLEMSRLYRPGNLFFTPQPTVCTHFPPRDLWDFLSAGLLSCRILTGSLQGAQNIPQVFCRVPAGSTQGPHKNPYRVPAESL